jgi:hypothetical protein
LEKRWYKGKGREAQGKVKGMTQEGMGKGSEGEGKGEVGREGLLEVEGKGRRRKPGWGH